MVETSVFPSPVFISAMAPRCSAPAPDDLDVVVPLPQHPPRRLPDHGERLGFEVVEEGALRQPFPEGCGLGAQRLIVERLDLGLETVDPPYQGLEILEGATFSGAQHLVEEGHGRHGT